MTQDQYLMLVRMLLQMAGMFLISKNVFTDSDWTAVAGAVMTLAGTTWTLYARRAAGLKQSVAAMPNTLVVNHNGGDPVTVANKLATIPEVKEVLTTSEVAQATPSGKIVDVSQT